MAAMLVSLRMTGYVMMLMLLAIAFTAPAHANSAASGWGGQIVFTQTGLASFYAATGPTASGQRAGPEELVAAHRDLPFGTKVKVTHLQSGHEVVVTVIDRGPFIKGRVIDISRKAAEVLGIIAQGVAQVRLMRID